MSFQSLNKTQNSENWCWGGTNARSLRVVSIEEYWCGRSLSERNLQSFCTGWMYYKYCTEELVHRIHFHDVGSTHICRNSTKGFPSIWAGGVASDFLRKIIFLLTIYKHGKPLIRHFSLLWYLCPWDVVPLTFCVSIGSQVSHSGWLVLSSLLEVTLSLLYKH
jgi:hypothetical protein